MVINANKAITTDYTPSTEWLERERLRLIYFLSFNLTSVLPSTNGPSKLVILDCLTRIELISSQPAKWLESNRQEILNGNL